MAAVAVVGLMARRSGTLLLLVIVAIVAGTASGAALVGDKCAAGSQSPCGDGMRCASCSPLAGAGAAVCSRITPIDPKTHGTGLPFNKYSWLTTHNSFAMAGTTSPSGTPVLSTPNQEDTVADQLKNGVRGLMLDTYDYNNDLWLCHSFSGKCYEITAFQRASKVFKEVEGFLNANPDEVVTLFVEEYTAAGALGKALSAAGLTKYVFPPASMPKDGADWPPLKDMIAQNHRLLVFTSKQGREGSDGAAFQWDYVVETQYGGDGLVVGACPKRAESKPMDSKGQSLVLLNFFTTNPSQSWACVNNSAPLISKLRACYDASAKRWPNYIAVDFYMRSSGGGAPLATDVANGRLQCGCDSIAYCKANASFGTCALPSSTLSSPPSSPPSPSPPSASSSPKSLALASSPSSKRSMAPSSSPSAAPARSRSWSSSAALSLFSFMDSNVDPSLSTSVALSPSLAPSSLPSLGSAKPSTLSPLSSPSASSPSSSLLNKSPKKKSPKSTINVMSVDELNPESTTTDEGATPKASSNSTPNQGMSAEASPSGTPDTGAPQRTLPKSIAEPPTPTTHPEAENTSSAAIRPKTPRRSSLIGTALLVLISLS
ncbi:unnamed protein product [Triticum aestivum]|uniref:Phosphatidylinositol-specific phospholipase C X domain-containing protein n=2 Tax=Triticum aestivum TaxID=4565 RepID=A0A9R1JJQ6_WHEAT|nr:PI-PLC X domain-containing protein At5g67130-like isoform X1 [Triticum aestivum]KAF7019865.1 hypothetical protein CFC21_032995 [Triticum aestivum]SPT21087.1 unnamed protein product [Triticum aestivum]